MGKPVVGRRTLGALRRRVRRAAVAVAAATLLAGMIGVSPAPAATPKTTTPHVTATPALASGGSCSLSAPFGAPAAQPFGEAQPSVTASPGFKPQASTSRVPGVRKYRTPVTSHIVPGPSRNSPTTGYSLTTVTPAVATLSISGTVTGPDDAPLAGMKVQAYGTGSFLGTTAVDGTYTVNVPAGTYLVYVYDPNAAHPAGYYSVTGYVADYRKASDVIVGHDLAGIDVKLPSPIWIQGKVTAAGGAGLGGISVGAYDSDIDNGGTAKTAGDGTFAIAVTPGSYEVGFSDEAGVYASGYYGLSGYTANSALAAPVSVTASDVPGIDVELPLAIHIKGTVTSPANAPLAGIAVFAMSDTYINTATTGADGTYSVVVVAGSYYVAMADPAGHYPMGYYSASGLQSDPGNATKVAVAAADVSGINLKYAAPIYLSGKVTAPGGAGIAGITVIADASYGTNGATTIIDGTWSIPVLAGSYLLSYSDDSDTYAPGYYSNTGYQWDRANATPVAVTTANVPNLNAQLPLSVHISGTITGPGDVPMPNIEVTAYGSFVTRRTITDADGHYTVPASHGTYHVGVRDPAGVYVSGYYSTLGFTTDPISASAIPVVSSDVTSINVKLPQPIYIKGTVTGPGATPLEGISVVADSLAYQAEDTTGADGTFALSVIAGSYHVSYCDSTGIYGSGYYSDLGLTIDPNAASPVTVTTTDRTGISVELPLAIHITGKVTGEGGVPLPDIDVTATSNTVMSSATTRADGTFSVVVVPGTYFVSFEDFELVYDSGYYSTGGFTTDENNATPVVVGSADVPDINVQMTLLVLPTAHMSVLPTFLATTSIAVKWSGTPGTNPIEGYDVRYRRAAWNGSGFTSYTLWKSDTYGSGATLTGVAGSTYCFSARAIDWMGLMSAWSAEVCTAVSLDDRSLTKSSGWSAKTGSAYYKSTYVQTTKSGAKLTASKVTAQRIAVVATMCSTCGSIKVYWGSTLLKTISLKSAKTVNKKLITVVAWPAPKTGTLYVKVASSGKKVIIDGVAIRRT
ncbi:MAG: carboxypeptidase-like regulatory domain-containing protein [Chloroflexota bacterium]